MTRVWPIHHCFCHPILKLPHWMPVMRPPQRCFPQKRMKTLKRLCSCMQYSILAMLIILLVLWIGKHVEDKHVQRAQSTVDLYTKPQVCALQHIPDDIFNNTRQSSSRKQRQRYYSSSPQHERRLQHLSFIQTLENVTVARQEPNTIIAHCGDCGSCSTPRDVLIYDETKNTLTDTSTKCAKLGLIGGRRRASKCMEEHVGLSEACTKCWVENIMCSIKSCVFTCLLRQLTSWGDEKSVAGELNDCTRCDELRCGRAFLNCAGANRRRTGIVSDIARDNEQEVCMHADEEFWRNQEIQLWYQSLVANETTNVEPETRLLRGLRP